MDNQEEKEPIYTLFPTTKYRKDYDKFLTQESKLNAINEILTILAYEGFKGIPLKHRPHILKGNYMYNTFSDIPTVKDEFMIDKYILGLSNFITGCETPLTLAIQGDWGTGKTSIMYQVEEKLKEKSSSNSKRKIKTIFFNTWQYSQFDMDKDLAVTLITDLIDELEYTLNNLNQIIENDENKKEETVEELLGN